LVAVAPETSATAVLLMLLAPLVTVLVAVAVPLAPFALAVESRSAAARPWLTAVEVATPPTALAVLVACA